MYFNVGWKDISSETMTSGHTLLLARIEGANGTPTIAMTVAVGEDFTWKLHIQGRILDPLTLPTCASSVAWPTLLSSISRVHEVLGLLHNIKICPGIPDANFHPIVERRKGKFMDHSGKQCHVYVFLYADTLCTW